MPGTGTVTKPELPPTQPLGWLDRRFPMLRRDRIEFLSGQAALGDVTTFRMGPARVYFINHPDLIRDLLVMHAEKFEKGRALKRAKTLLGEGLLTSEGSAHLRHRRMIQPAFHRNRIAEYARVMTANAERMAAEWQDGKTLDIDQEMMHLTLRIVAKTLFDAEVDSEADDVGRSLTDVVSMFNLLLLPFSEVLEKLPFPHSRRLKRARKTLDDIIYKIIDERRVSGEDTGDLLSMLLDARDEDDGGAMTDRQIRDECMTLFLAGHETTANALVWTWYLLSQNPDAEAKLHAELDQVLTGRTPTIEDISALKFTGSVLAESMRLFPPAWAIGRYCIADHELGGYHVPAGSTVLMSPYILHRDGRFWNEPNEFRPERWETKNVKEAGAENIYFPFGGGVRRCIGESFAWSEGILLLAALARTWTLSLVPGQAVVPKPMITLRPKFGIRMQACRRVLASQA